MLSPLDPVNLCTASHAVLTTLHNSVLSLALTPVNSHAMPTYCCNNRIERILTETDNIWLLVHRQRFHILPGAQIAIYFPASVAIAMLGHALSSEIYQPILEPRPEKTRSQAGWLGGPRQAQCLPFVDAQRDSSTFLPYPEQAQSGIGWLGGPEQAVALLALTSQTGCLHKT